MLAESSGGSSGVTRGAYQRHLTDDEKLASQSAVTHPHFTLRNRSASGILVERFTAKFFSHVHNYPSAFIR